MRKVGYIRRAFMTILLTLVFIHCVGVSGSGKETARKVRKKTIIHVKYVFDKNFPIYLPRAEREKMFVISEKLIRRKFGIEVKFVYKGQIDVNEFFSVVPTSSINTCASLIKDFSLTKYKQTIKDHIEALLLSGIHSFEEYKSFFPKTEVGSLDEIADKTANHYYEVLAKIKGSSVQKAALVVEGKEYLNSLRCWWEVLEIRKPTYMVFTNVPIINDIPAFAFHISAVQVIVGGTPDLVSIFPCSSEIYFLKEFHTTKTSAGKLYAIAAILTHEIGHRILKFRDTYDGKKIGCAMYVGPKIRGYFERYKSMIENVCQDEMK